MKKTLSTTLLILASSSLMLGGASNTLAQESTQEPINGCPEYQHQAGSKHQRSDLSKLQLSLKQLDLSEQQKTSIEAILTAAKPQISALRKQRKEGHETLHLLAAQDNFDIKAVDKAADDEASVMIDTIVLRVKAKADILKVLTPEQRRQLAEIYVSKRNN